MGYLTVNREAKSEFEEKKSVFIGHVKRVFNEEAARQFIQSVRGQHREANHNVYAYIIGQNKGIQRYSDDGEPQGTGGVPVLEVLKKNDVTDVVVVVTRYFGGIMLGAGGLVRAYSKGAALAVRESGIVERIKGCSLCTVVDYDMLGKVQYYCNQQNWHIENTEYSENVKVFINVSVENVDNIQNQLTEITSGRSSFQKTEVDFYFKGEDQRLYQ